MRYKSPKPKIEMREVEGEKKLCMICNDGYKHTTVTLLQDVIDVLQDFGYEVETKY